MIDLSDTTTIDSGAKAEWRFALGVQECFIIPVGDQGAALTTGTNKVVFRMPFGLLVTDLRASLTTPSSSGLVIVDINENGTSIMSTNKLTIDASEKTSTTAATPAGITDVALANDAEITIDVDGAGTGAAGLKVYIIGWR